MVLALSRTYQGSFRLKLFFGCRQLSVLFLTSLRYYRGRIISDCSWVISCRSATCQFAFSRRILVRYCPRLAFESKAGPHYFWGGCFCIVRNFMQGSWQHSSYPCSAFWCQHNLGALSPFALDIPLQALKLCDELICHRCHLRLCSLRSFECFYGY